MGEVYKMQKPLSSSVDELLRLDIAEARINHTIVTTQVLSPDFHREVSKWHPQVELAYGASDVDDFPCAYVNDARVFLNRDREAAPETLEAEARNEQVGNVLFVQEHYFMPTDHPSARIQDMSFAEFILLHGLDESAGQLEHGVVVGHRNRPADFTQSTLSDAQLDLPVLHVVADADRSFQKPESAHVIVPERTDVQRFVRFCIRDADFGQDSTDFLAQHAETFPDAEFVIGSGFEKYY